MSIHSEVSSNVAKQFIENLCEQRWRKMKDPCKGCKYRFPVKDEVNCCIFATVPRDWSTLENRV